MTKSPPGHGITMHSVSLQSLQDPVETPVPSSRLQSNSLRSVLPRSPFLNRTRVRLGIPSPPPRSLVDPSLPIPSLVVVGDVVFLPRVVPRQRYTP